jgi:membrane protease YdiL (CAAX protease family)
MQETDYQPEEYRPKPFWLTLLSLVASGFAGIFIGSFIASLTAPLVFKISVDQVADIILDTKEHPLKGALLRYIQLWTSGLGFVGGGWFFLARIVKSIDQVGLDLKSLPSPPIFFMAIGSMAMLLPATEWLQWLNNQINFPESMATLEANLRYLQKLNLDQIKLMIEPENTSLWLYNLILIAVLPAVGEELVFRGALQNLLIGKFGARFGILLTAVIFTLIHRQFYNILPMFVLSLLLGYVYYLTGSLFTTIAMHLLNNALSLFMVYYFGWTDDITQPEFSPLISFPLAVVGVILLIWMNSLIDSQSSEN